MCTMINLLPLPSVALSYRFQSNESMPFEILHRSFAILGCTSRLECAQIPSLPRLRIFLPRIQSIAAGFKFSDHTAFFSPFILKQLGINTDLHQLGCSLLLCIEPSLFIRVNLWP